MGEGDIQTPRHIAHMNSTWIPLIGCDKVSSQPERSIATVTDYVGDSAREMREPRVRDPRLSGLSIPVPSARDCDGNIHCVQPVARPTLPVDLRTNHFLCEQ